MRPRAGFHPRPLLSLLSPALFSTFLPLTADPVGRHIILEAFHLPGCKEPSFTLIRGRNWASIPQALGNGEQTWSPGVGWCYALLPGSDLLDLPLAPSSAEFSSCCVCPTVGGWHVRGGSSFPSSCNILDSSGGKVRFLHTKAPVSCQRPEFSIYPKLPESYLFCPAPPHST